MKIDNSTKIQTTIPERGAPVPTSGLAGESKANPGVPSGIYPCSSDATVPTAGMTGDPSVDLRNPKAPAGIHNVA